MNPERAVFLGKEQTEQTLFSVVRVCQCHVRVHGEDTEGFPQLSHSENADSVVWKFLPASLVFFPCSTSSCDLMGLN